MLESGLSRSVRGCPLMGIPTAIQGQSWTRFLNSALLASPSAKTAAAVAPRVNLTFRYMILLRPS